MGYPVVNWFDKLLHNFLESSPLEEQGGSENEGVADLSLNYEKNLNSFKKSIEWFKIIR